MIRKKFPSVFGRPYPYRRLPIQQSQYALRHQRIPFSHISQNRIETRFDHSFDHNGTKSFFYCFLLTLVFFLGKISIDIHVKLNIRVQPSWQGARFGFQKPGVQISPLGPKPPVFSTKAGGFSLQRVILPDLNTLFTPVRTCVML